MKLSLGWLIGDKGVEIWREYTPEVYQNPLQVTDRLCQKFRHGGGVVEGVETLIGPIGIAQGLVHAVKGGSYDQKLQKMGKMTTIFKKI